MSVIQPTGDEVKQSTTDDDGNTISLEKAEESKSHSDVSSHSIHRVPV